MRLLSLYRLGGELFVFVEMLALQVTHFFQQTDDLVVAVVWHDSLCLLSEHIIRRD